MSAQAKLRAVLTGHLGGDPRGHVAASLARRSESLARRLNLSGHDLAQTLGRVEDDPRRESGLWEAILAELTVGETYFFRGLSGLAALRETVFPSLRRRERRVRGLTTLWSAGCSTGQEVYTVAYLARQALEGRLLVLGTDINEARLAVARSGSYPLGSMRSKLPIGFADKVEDQLRPRPLAETRLQFTAQNLASDPPPRRGVQLILCRNTLLYLNAEARTQALARFVEALEPGGWLLLGEHDQVRPGEALPAELRPIAGQSGLFERGLARELEPASLAPKSSRPALEPAKERAAPRRSKLARPLDSARGLLASGDLRGAEKACLRAADLDPSSAEPVLLLAEIALARGEPVLAESFLEGVREVAGSDPRHQDLLARARRQTS